MTGQYEVGFLSSTIFGRKVEEKLYRIDSLEFSYALIDFHKILRTVIYKINEIMTRNLKNRNFVQILFQNHCWNGTRQCLNFLNRYNDKNEFLN